jgi:tetratricopeptide (TPR) repeat protein
MLANQYPQAEHVFRQAAQRLPTDADALPHYASVAERLGHLDEARQALVRYSILVDQDRHKASHAERIADLSLALNDAAAAVSWYRRSESLSSEDASLLARLADAQARTGALEEARATVLRALERNPVDPTRAVARRLKVPLTVQLQPMQQFRQTLPAQSEGGRRSTAMAGGTCQCRADEPLLEFEPGALQRLVRHGLSRSRHGRRQLCCADDAARGAATASAVSTF